MNDVFKPAGQRNTTPRASLLKLNQPMRRTNHGQKNIAPIIWNNFHFSWIYIWKCCNIRFICDGEMYLLTYLLTYFRTEYGDLRGKKCPNAEFFLVRIFLYSDWKRRFMESATVNDWIWCRILAIKIQNIVHHIQSLAIFVKTFHAEIIDNILNTPLIMKS